MRDLQPTTAPRRHPPKAQKQRQRSVLILPVGLQKKYHRRLPRRPTAEKECLFLYKTAYKSALMPEVFNHRIER